MNERQLPGLSLDLPCGSCKGSTERRARAMLRLQRRYQHTRTEWCDDANRVDTTHFNSRSAAVRSVHSSGVTAIHSVTSAESRQNG
jgi:hypothetical protein